MATYEAWNESRAAEIIADTSRQDGAALPILHALQETFGFIHHDAVPMVAKTLNLTRAEMHGIVTFYHDFRDHPPGRHTVKLCRAEACQSMGGEALAKQARDTLRVDWHGTTTDGRVTLEPVYCLGLCACAPSVMIDGKVYGALNQERLGALLTRVRTA